MNGLPIRTAFNPSVERMNQKTPTSEAIIKEPPLVRPSKIPSEGPSVLVAQISAVKVLAATLVKYVESLEEKIERNERCYLNLHDELRYFEVEMIRNALKKTGGRKRRAARLLGMKATTLFTKIKRYKLDNAD